jgi:parallel beta-helix repeat protein
MKKLYLVPGLLFALAALSAGAFAGDAERTPLSATATPGNANYVYRITAPGSYYLSASLVGDAGRSGIEITVADVTLDLNGYTVIGPGGDGTGADGKRGIVVSHPSGPGRIYNGSVRNWKGDGIYVDSASITMDSLNASDNQGCGFRLEGSSTGTLTQCVAEQNGLDGFNLKSSSGMTVDGCSARFNGRTGFDAADASLRGCTATLNQEDGFVVAASVLVQCVAVENKKNGIMSWRSSVLDCMAKSNKANGIHARIGNVQRCTVYSNDLNGIVAEDGVLVRSNQVSLHRGNGNTLLPAAGILVQLGGNRIEGNNVTYNTHGIRVVDTGNIIVGNTAKSWTTNYSMVAGNRVGTIVVPPLSGAINGNSGAAGTGATDPWSNIAY